MVTMGTQWLLWDLLQTEIHLWLLSESVMTMLVVKCCFYNFVISSRFIDVNWHSDVGLSFPFSPIIYLFIHIFLSLVWLIDSYFFKGLPSDRIIYFYDQTVTKLACQPYKVASLSILCLPRILWTCALLSGREYMPVCRKEVMMSTSRHYFEHMKRKWR